ncbi:hypothetical protein [Bacterioplanoides sp. SCSIO 12839]|uniref:hypothetical protein n=1 Tax=Bacterioplanoides sp. SCSIO 12839 TaxID=2829569 RepID=UPI002107956D|nr:hypothetical protein [Bacterioplanoides sp. SCSIO 12839]UTW49009.1 hypothetical protein KFF03_03635 [Bacterioplanoides sp. SCSIO 12839]
MVIPLKRNANRLINLALVSLALVSCYVFVVASLRSLGDQRPVTADDNIWLIAADQLAINNPDVSASLAYYQRQQAFYYESEQRQQLLRSSLNHWQKASALRPLWPYYQLGALDIEVILDQPAAQIQSRITWVISLTPNERGLDKSLLELAVFSWEKLTQGQKDWMLKRLKLLNHSELLFVLEAAEKVNKKALLCAYLPFTKIRRYCR